MANYRRRLEQDLDGWIERGLVPAQSRSAILDTAREARRLNAAAALAIIGGLLAGVAAIAFIAANWNLMPRVARFVLILAVFLGAAGGAAWATARGRTVAGHVLLSVAALIFAAAIGLTGQIFDIAGEPQMALRGAGLAAILLALAGRSPWAAAVGLALLTLGDFAHRTRFGSGEPAAFGWLILAVPLGAAVALHWRSQALAHVTGIAAILAVVTLEASLRQGVEPVFLAASAVLAAGAGAVRLLRDRGEGPAAVLYGWLAWGAMIWFGASGLGDQFKGVVHSMAWLGLSVAVVALGRHDRHALVTAAGVVSLFAAGSRLLFDLGVGLMTSAVVFGGAALAALAVAWAIRGRRPA